MTWSSVRVPSTSSCSRRARTSGLAALPESLARGAGAAATPRTRRVRKRARRLASALGSGPTFHPPTRPTTAASSRVRAPREPSRRGTSAEVRLRGHVDGEAPDPVAARRRAFPRRPAAARRGRLSPEPARPPAHLSSVSASSTKQAWREPESTLWRRSDAARSRGGRTSPRVPRPTRRPGCSRS